MIYLEENLLKNIEKSCELEMVVLKELTDYKIYAFEASLEGLLGDEDLIHAVITSLSLVIGKYQDLSGDDLEQYINLSIFNLVSNGYVPGVYVAPILVDLFVYDLSESFNQQAVS